MQSNADGDYRFILNYQDPLKTKTAEVIHTLLDIFTIEATGVLQSDNGREFANNIVSELTGMWPELKIVHGKMRHSQSQGSTDRTNQDVQNIDNKRERSESPWKCRYTVPSGMGEHYCSWHGSLAVHKACPW
jgi:hypothetical protein